MANSAARKPTRADIPPGAIVHLTTVHARHDSRIFGKQVRTLAAALEVPVIMMVADGLGDEVPGGSPAFVDLGRTGGRLGRMVLGSVRAWRALAQLRPRLVHFHDPELMPLAMALSLRGVKVVYDVHEDLPRDLATKAYVPRLLQRPASLLAGALEAFASRFFAGISAATPTIGQRFPAARTAVVQNFPILAELDAPVSRAYATRPQDFAYVGGVAVLRGALQMVEAIERMRSSTGRLIMAGTYQPPAIEDELRRMSGWDRVRFEGWKHRQGLAELMGRVRAGLVLLHPLESYRLAYPIKMFEYMAAGLPVVASDFPLWRSIIGEADCGIVVDPLDPSAIAQALDWIVDNPAEAEAMGRRGRAAVTERFNWSAESAKLLSLYERILR